MTRSEQSRINGSKSQGPVTPQGKARSAANHTSHGMYSTRVVLENESKEIFQILAGLYHDLFLAQDQFETDLIDSLVHSRWKIRRLEAAHSAELNLAILEHRRANAEKYGDVIGPDIQTALAYRTNGAYLETLDKHMERQERLFHRSYRTLARHRKNQPLPTIEELQDLEQDIPSNAAPAAPEPTPNPEPKPAAPAETTQNERFEPSGPNPFQKIAIIIVLLLSSIAYSLSTNSAQPPEWTTSPYATL